MASTRARTCSFLCRSAARSPARDSCRARSARFSSFSCSTTVDQLFDPLLETRELELELLFLLVSLMVIRL